MILSSKRVSLTSLNLWFRWETYISDHRTKVNQWHNHLTPHETGKEIPRVPPQHTGGSKERVNTWDVNQWILLNQIMQDMIKYLTCWQYVRPKYSSSPNYCRYVRPSTSTWENWTLNHYSLITIVDQVLIWIFC